MTAQLRFKDSSKRLQGTFVILPRATYAIFHRQLLLPLGGNTSTACLSMDKDFAKPGRIDILLGVDLYAALMKSNRIQLQERLFMQETLLGWVVSGAAGPAPSHRPRSIREQLQDYDTEMVFNHVIDIKDAQRPLKKLREIKEVPPKLLASTKQVACEQNWTDTTAQDTQRALHREMSAQIGSWPFKSCGTPESSGSYTTSHELPVLASASDKREQGRKPHREDDCSPEGSHQRPSYVFANTFASTR